MSKHIQLVGQSDTGKLSKEQIKFNTYLQRIKALKTEIKVLKEAHTWLIQVGTERVLPIDRLDMIAYKDFLLALDGHRELYKLSARQQRKFEDIMVHELHEVLSYEDFDDLKPIFEKYSGKNYDEHIAEAEAIAKQHAVDKMNTQYDLDLDVDDDIEQILEKKQRKIEAKEAQEAAATERRANKTKTDKQQARAEKLATAEADMNKTTKQVYVDLVKNFHPDKETDESRRQWKTEIMQKVTVAYKENDFLQLLELQMSLLEERENSLQKLADEQLKRFNKSLFNQINDLEAEVDAAHPQFNGNPFGRFYSPHRTVSEVQMEKHIKLMKRQTKSRRSNIEYIRTLFGLKEYIDQFNI